MGLPWREASLRAQPTGVPWREASLRAQPTGASLRMDTLKEHPKSTDRRRPLPCDRGLPLPEWTRRVGYLTAMKASRSTRAPVDAGLWVPSTVILRLWATFGLSPSVDQTTWPACTVGEYRSTVATT